MCVLSVTVNACVQKSVIFAIDVDTSSYIKLENKDKEKIN